MSIKVLTVEDSVLMRRIINDLITEMDGIELVGTARNGVVALKQLQDVQPDIITLDVEMPVMDGLETLKKLREKIHIPVIMLSSRNDEETTLKALEIGAQDFLQKPVNIRENREAFHVELEQHIKALVKNHSYEPNQSTVKTESQRQVFDRKKPIDALVVGASTGGPKAILSLIRSLPSEVKVPIFIVQHMPEGFTASFAKRLDQFSSIPVVEAEDGMRIEKGIVYLAPGGKHMVLDPHRIRLMDTEKVHGVKPAVNPLFETAAKQYGENIAAILLTGMGRDGTSGCLEIKQKGGYVLAQNQESCVVYGMPKNAMEAGAVDRMLSLEEITIMMREMVKV